MLRPLDVDDDRMLERVHGVLAACHEEASPRVPFQTEAETIGYLRFPVSLRRPMVLVDADVDGVARLGLAAASGWLTLAVRPGARGRGLGGALFAAIRECARAQGCTSLAGRYAGPEGAAFARRVGALDTRVDVTSLLELAAASIPPRSEAVELRSWVGPAPDELIPSYVVARNVINDAPASNDDEVYVYGVEDVRAFERACEARGRELRVTVALERGRVVSFTELRWTPGVSHASTEDTATLASHRGRGLASAVKAESLRRLAADHPEVTLVTTTNAAENRAILSVNRRLGFREAARATTASLSL
ncbi:MAG TPA: GNAT family N-acetyltransferase [Gaiellaceae bacterium]|nr:GNAT family N-acetyltransferase [Gaiellaceae bacterium]